MPISAPGSSRRDSGFTLLELLLVILLMGIAVSLVSISLSGSERHLEVEAKRLATLIDHAVGRARLTGVSLAWQAQERGYRFMRRDEVWHELPQTGDEVLHARQLPEGLSVAVIPPAGAGAMTSGASPVPATVVFPAGGLGKPFVLRMVGAGGAAYRIAGDANGHIDLAREAEP